MENRARILVDGIAYSVSKSKAEVACESKDPAAIYLILNNAKHRKSVCDAASIVHREAEVGGWMSERPDTWSISCGSKTLKVSWDGSLPADSGENALRFEGSKKAYNLAAEVIKAVKATQTRRAEDINQMSMESFNKPVDQLDENELRQLLQKMQSKVSPNQPQAPIVPNAPSNSAPAPVAPGAASAVNVRWMRSAEDDKKAPPFGKKDDKADDKKDEKDDKPKGEDKSEKKDEKKPEPKKDDKPSEKKDAPKKDKPAEPKKDKAPSKSDEKKDEKLADEAIKSLEELIKREESEGEGGPHLMGLKKALEELKKFKGEEGAEMGAPAPGIPMTVDLPIVKEPLPPAGPIKPAVPMAPKPMPLPAARQDGLAGFRLGDAVWHKTEAGADFEPGRIVEFGGGKVIVDWGDADGVLAEYSALELVRATVSDRGADLFAAESGSELSGIEDEVSLPDEKSQIENILASMSVKEVLNKKTTAGSNNEGGITHIATGRAGDFLAHTSDGRCLVRLDGEETYVWPVEIKFNGETSLF